MDSYIADRIGRMNALIICNIISGLSSFLIWVFAYDYNTMMAFAVVFGLVCSIYFSSSKSILHAITKIGAHVMMMADNAFDLYSVHHYGYHRGHRPVPYRLVSFTHDEHGACVGPIHCKCCGGSSLQHRALFLIQDVHRRHLFAWRSHSFCTQDQNDQELHVKNLRARFACLSFFIPCTTRL